MNSNYIKRNGLFNYYITKIKTTKTKPIGLVKVTVQLENPQTGLPFDGSGWTHEIEFDFREPGDKGRALKMAEFYAVYDMMDDLTEEGRDLADYLPKWSD